MLPFPKNSTLWPERWIDFIQSLNKEDDTLVGCGQDKLLQILGAPKIKRLKIEPLAYMVKNPVKERLRPIESDRITCLQIQDAEFITMEWLVQFLEDPEFWPSLQHIELLRHKEVPFNYLGIHTFYKPVMEKGNGNKLVFNKNKTFQTMILQHYTRETMVIIEGGGIMVDDYLDLFWGFVKERRAFLEGQGMKKKRFVRLQNGGVSFETLEQGFSYEEIGPVEVFSPTEDYSKWKCAEVIYIPRSLQEKKLLDTCQRLRQMVVNDSQLKVVIPEVFITKGGQVKLFNRPPPVFEDTRIHYLDPRVRAFIQKQSLISS